MPDHLDIPATITALASLVIAIGVIVTAVLGFLNRRASAAARDRATVAADAAVAAQVAAESSKTEIVATAKGIFEVGKKLDGRLSELLASETALARAQGIAQGEQSQRDRQSPPEGGR